MSPARRFPPKDFSKGITTQFPLPRSHWRGTIITDMFSLRSISTAIMLVVMAIGPAAAALGPCCCTSKAAQKEETPACCVQHERPASSPVHECRRTDVVGSNPQKSVIESSISQQWIAGCCCVRPVVATPATESIRSGLIHPDVAIAEATAPRLPREHVANAATFFEPGLTFAIAPPLNVLNCVWLE